MKSEQPRAPRRRPSRKGKGARARDPRPLFARMRGRFWLRATAVLVAAAFLNLYLQPLALATNLPKAPRAEFQAPSNEARLSETLRTLEDRLERLEAKLDARQAATREQDDLDILRQELELLDEQAIKDFQAIERHLKAKKLPAVILERHYEAVDTYRREMQTLKANLRGLESAASDAERKAKVKQVREHLKAKHPRRGPKTKFDPNDLPNKSLQPNPDNKPKRNKKEFIRAGLTDNPKVQLATHGSFNIDRLPSANDPAYLGESDEIVLTQAIRDKAAELEHHPVKIYNWVRNHVEWLPTWGATQDADVTLGSRRGNAFDIASLLIALLRASDIPARYVHGVVNVPEDKFRNWAGGFESVTAAQHYASSGGVPVTGLVSGGEITTVQLEHIWVEAAIDFEPSRGAINRSADRWVALDASFKQYQDLEGLDVVEIAGLDPEALAQSFAESGTINEAEGWVQNLNPAILENAQTQAQSALEAHIDANLPEPTAGDVIGGRQIIEESASVLPTALPNQTVLTGARYGKLPPQLQHTMTLAFGIDRLGEPINPVTFPWARLNNHKVTLSFRPATAADEAALESFLSGGSMTDPSQLPNSIPSYLITVVPQIAVEGQVVGEGGALRLGEEFVLVFVAAPAGRSPDTFTYQVPAGSYLNVAVAGGSVSATGAERLKTRIARTNEILGSGDPVLIDDLTQEHLSGDLFYAGALAYFGQVITLSQAAGIAHDTLHNLPVAYGTLGYEPTVDTLFGLPRSISVGGVAVNVRLGSAIQSRDGDAPKRRQLAFIAGLVSSALEHAVPEQMFSTSEELLSHGVSAVKAIQLAAQQGQRIYRITPENQAQVLPTLQLDVLAMNEISEALATGKEVITHTHRISVGAWTGEGYIVLDPVTGAGAYKIAGGSNGGFLSGFVELLGNSLDVLGLLLQLIGLEIASWAAQVADFILTMLTVWTNCDAFWAPWLTFLATSFTVAGAATGIVVGVVFASVFLGAIVAFLISFILVKMFIGAVIERRCS